MKSEAQALAEERIGEDRMEMDGERQEEPDDDVKDDCRARRAPVGELARGQPETRRISEKDEDQPALVPNTRVTQG